MKYYYKSLLLFFTIFFFYLIFLPSAHFPSDTLYSLETAKSISKGKLSVLPDEKLPNLAVGREGRFYSKYGLGYALIFLPAALISRIITSEPASEYVFIALASFTNTIAATVIIFCFVILFRKFGYSGKVVYFSALSIAIASVLLPYSKINHTEIPSTALLMIFFVLYSDSSRPGIRRLMAMGTIASLLILLKIGNIVYFMTILGSGLFIILKDKWSFRKIISFSGVPLITVTFMLFYNYYRFSDPFNFGYGSEQRMFVTPVYIGLTGLLFSPSKSLFLFSPLVIPSVIGLAKCLKKSLFTVIPAAIMIIGNICFYARWHDWHGGWSWGPRLIVPSIILLHMFLPEFIAAFRRNLFAILIYIILFSSAIYVNILGASVWYQQIYYFHHDYNSVKNSHVVIATKIFLHKISKDDEIYECKYFNCDCTAGHFKRLWGDLVEESNSIHFNKYETFRGFAFPWSTLRRNFQIEYLWIIPCILATLSAIGSILLWKMSAGEKGSPQRKSFIWITQIIVSSQ